MPGTLMLEQTASLSAHRYFTTRHSFPHSVVAGLHLHQISVEDRDAICVDDVVFIFWLSTKFQVFFCNLRRGDGFCGY